MVWTRCILSSGDDREIHSLVTLIKDPSTDLRRNLRFSSTNERYLSILKLRSNPVDSLSRSAQRRHFVGIFDSTKRADHRCGGVELEIRANLLEFNKKPRPGSLSDCGAARSTNEPGNDSDGIIDLAPRTHREDLISRYDTGNLEFGNHQSGVAIDWQHQHREPLKRHSFGSGEPWQIGTDRKQTNVNALFSH
jgi:hypothetical protein